jgi:hypothetical protein
VKCWSLRWSTRAQRLTRLVQVGASAKAGLRCWRSHFAKRILHREYSRAMFWVSAGGCSIVSFDSMSEFTITGWENVNRAMGKS